MQSGFFEKVYEIVKQIPCGKVATYGQVAQIIGKPHASRQVGFALHANPMPTKIPCHRIVNRFGHLAEGFAFGGKEEQKKRLINEGIEFKNDMSIDLNRFGWVPPSNY